MAAIEVLSGSWAGGASADSPITMAQGDTLQIRNAAIDQRPMLTQVWGNTTSDASIRIRSPNFHDNVEGIRIRLESAEIVPQLPWAVQQMLTPQDTLNVTTVEGVGASEVRDFGFLIYYPELPGIQARLVGYEELQNVVDIKPVRVTIATTPSINWQGNARITQDEDLLRANTDYAVLGYDVDRSCNAIGIRGVDTGNLRIGGPGDNNARWVTTNWFTLLTEKLGKPCIPVFNSANKNGLFIDVVRSESGAAVTVTLYLGRFRQA
jgi:hypothetical protein